MRARALLTLTVTIVAALSLQCRGREQTAASQTFSGAPIIIISIDTLRADHLPAYGYANVATPAIDALRHDGVLYRNAYAHVPMTLPSHVSLLTGLLPPEHGVRNNLGYDYDAKKHPALPMLLKPQGYATGAAISAYVLRGSTGIASAFDWYDDAVNTRANASVGELSRDGDATVQSARDWIASRGASPFFLLLHLYEPHTPYAPREPFKSRYASAYDGEIATADSYVGTFLDDLKARGIYDRAIIVLLSDHGEGLGDHGEQEHGVFVYREAIHVPLIVKLPKSARAGETIDAPVQLIDVAPTLLQLAGAEVPPAMSGRSLLAQAVPSDRRIYSETYFPRIHLGWSELRSFTDARHQYIEAPKPELFDLAADPHEKTNVLENERRVYAELKQAMAPYRVAAANATNVDPEEAAKLAALGYVGSVRSSDANAQLPDPKDHIGELERMKRADHLDQTGDHRAAIEIYRSILQENPRFTDAWLKLAIAYESQGQLATAVEYYKRAIDTAPDLAPGLALSVGSLQLQMGDLAKAEGHARLALTRSPGGGHLLLARIAMARKDFATAEQEARMAMSDRVRARDAAVALAQIMTAQNRLPEALDVVDGAKRDAEASHFSVENLESTRGDILARMGHYADAEGAFRAEIAAFPANRDAYTKLAVLYISQNRLADARAALEQMIRVSPGKQTALMAAATYEAVDLPQEAARWRRLAAALQ